MITLNEKENKEKSEYLDKIAKEFENIKNPIWQKEIKVDEIEDLNISEVTQDLMNLCQKQIKEAIRENTKLIYPICRGEICSKFREAIRDCQFTIKNGTYYIKEDDLKEKIDMIEKGE